MYQPGSLLPGAREFYAWLRGTGKPFVLLSNTGAKGSLGVQKKLSSAPYTLEGPPLPLRNAYTAAEAQMEYLRHTIPSRAKVFVISGGDFWMNTLRMKDPLLYDSWELRTSLTSDEAKEWAVEAKERPGTVFCIFFIDGAIGETSCPSGSGKEGVSDWSFETIQKAAYMCHAGAQFVYTADDAFNPSVDERWPGMVFPQPGPGMFAAMMKTVMFPEQSASWCCCGKGGNVGKTYMMEHAIKMLQVQGHSGDRSRIMMIGDRFDTDIKAGVSVGIRTCLVESGCHTVDMQPSFAQDARADFVAPNVGALVPLPMPSLTSLRAPVCSTAAAATAGRSALSPSRHRRNSFEHDEAGLRAMQLQEQQQQQAAPVPAVVPAVVPAAAAAATATRASVACTTSVVEEESEVEESEDDDEEEALLAAEEIEIELEMQQLQMQRERRAAAAAAAAAAGPPSGPVATPRLGSGRERQPSDVFEVPSSTSPSASSISSLHTSADHARAGGTGDANTGDSDGDGMEEDEDAAASIGRTSFDATLAAAVSAEWSEAPPGCVFSQEPCASGEPDDCSSSSTASSTCSSSSSSSASAAVLQVVMRPIAQQDNEGCVQQRVQQQMQQQQMMQEHDAQHLHQQQQQQNLGSLNTSAGPPDFASLMPVEHRPANGPWLRAM